MVNGGLSSCGRGCQREGLAITIRSQLPRLVLPYALSARSSIHNSGCWQLQRGTSADKPSADPDHRAHLTTSTIDTAGAIPPLRVIHLQDKPHRFRLLGNQKPRRISHCLQVRLRIRLPGTHKCLHSGNRGYEKSDRPRRQRVEHLLGNQHARHISQRPNSFLCRNRTSARGSAAVLARLQLDLHDSDLRTFSASGKHHSSRTSLLVTAYTRSNSPFKPDGNALHSRDAISASSARARADQVRKGMNDCASNAQS